MFHHSLKKPIIWVLILISFAFIKVDDIINLPEHFPKPVYDFKNNPLTKEKIYLGRNLFYDPILSHDNKVPCENCHSPFTAFTHVDHALSHGIYDSIGTRNSPALMNLAWQKKFMWDGAINNLDMQALAPISHPAEMGSSIQEVVTKLRASKKYKDLFYKAFNDSIATGENTLKALSQFLLTLVSSGSRYDKFIQGKLKFTEQEENGYKLFKKHCAVCHTEPLFTNGSFENNGLIPDPLLKDSGRIKISANPSDAYKFKVPTLRNIEYTFPYMHDGRFKSLGDVMNHYTKGIHHSKTLSAELRNRIVLTSNEKVDIVSFLLTLSDKEFVFNPDHRFPSE
ncbi:MAG: c-type cytochrome [Flavobacteriales bacterium]|nr:c-type cytochrome [Flavobacteriales bacterium]